MDGLKSYNLQKFLLSCYFPSENIFVLVSVLEPSEIPSFCSEKYVNGEGGEGGAVGSGGLCIKRNGPHDINSYAEENLQPSTYRCAWGSRR